MIYHLGLDIEYLTSIKDEGPIGPESSSTI